MFIHENSFINFIVKDSVNDADELLNIIVRRTQFALSECICDLPKAIDFASHFKVRCFIRLAKLN